MEPPRCKRNPVSVHPGMTRRDRAAFAIVVDDKRIDGMRGNGDELHVGRKDPVHGGSALKRVVSAARDVQAASTAPERHSASVSDGQRTTLGLVRFEAAMQELKETREVFVAPLGNGAQRGCLSTRGHTSNRRVRASNRYDTVSFRPAACAHRLHCGDGRPLRVPRPVIAPASTKRG